MTREEMCAFMDGLSEKMVEKLAKSGNPGVLLADGVFRDQVQTLSRLKYCIVAQAYPQPDSPISGQTTLFEPDLGTLASTNLEPEHTESTGPQFTMVEVRAALAKARSKGVNVTAIVESFGVDSFPQIDKSQYGAVMAKLEEALNAT